MSFVLFKISMKIKILQFHDVMKDLFFHSNKNTAYILLDTIQLIQDFIIKSY